MPCALSPLFLAQIQSFPLRGRHQRGLVAGAADPTLHNLMPGGADAEGASQPVLSPHL